MIKYQILNAMAQIISNNPEKYRKFFTNSQDKVKLTVRDDSFNLDSSDNPWHKIIDEFVAKIHENIKCPKLVEKIQEKYSTSSSCNVTLNGIATMNAFKSYFSYEFMTMCGFP